MWFTWGVEVTSLGSGSFGLMVLAGQLRRLPWSDWFPTLLPLCTWQPSSFFTRWMLGNLGSGFVSGCWMPSKLCTPCSHRILLHTSLLSLVFAPGWSRSVHFLEELVFWANSQALQSTLTLSIMFCPAMDYPCFQSQTSNCNHRMTLQHLTTFGTPFSPFCRGPLKINRSDWRPLRKQLQIWMEVL